MAGLAGPTTMDEDEPRYMKRKVKGGDLTIDYDKRALVVRYEVEASVLGKYGDSMQKQHKKHKKTIKLSKVLGEHTNIPRLGKYYYFY